MFQHLSKHKKKPEVGSNKSSVNLVTSNRVEMNHSTPDFTMNTVFF